MSKLIVRFVIAKYRRRGVPGSGLHRIGELAKYSFSLRNASSHLPVHTNRLFLPKNRDVFDLLQLIQIETR